MSECRFPSELPFHSPSWPVCLEPIPNALPFGRLWYGEPDAISNAVGYAKFYSRSRDAVIRVYDQAGNVIDTHEHAGDFKEW
jgi:hypothetical protein